MANIQNRQNPDVNSIPTSDSSGAIEQENPETNIDNSDIEQPDNQEITPLPPDSQPVAPIEEPAETDEAPVGDVNDSPKRIAGEE